MTVHPKLAGRTCYHKYEVEPGLFTPGQFLEIDPRCCLDELGVPEDLRGLRALDIGAWDGPFTFELERRGAQVTALDIQDPDFSVFNAVREIRNSSANHILCGVYDALPENLGTFDLVLFAGVYYHLKNPVLSLQRIRRLLKDGGMLFIEGASTTDYLAGQLNKLLGLPQSAIDSTAAILDRLPISYFDIEKKVYPDWSNWFFPTTRCLEVMLLDSGFCDVHLELKRNAIYNYSHRRLMGRAHADGAKTDPARQEHEHWVMTADFISKRPLPQRSRLLRWVPPALRPTAERARRAVRRVFPKRSSVGRASRNG